MNSRSEVILRNKSTALELDNRLCSGPRLHHHTVSSHRAEGAGRDQPGLDLTDSLDAVLERPKEPLGLAIGELVLERSVGIRACYIGCTGQGSRRGVANVFSLATWASWR